MRQRGEGILRSSPWIATAALAAALVAVAAAGRGEGPAPRALDQAVSAPVTRHAIASAVAENTTIAAIVREKTTVGESLPAVADSRTADPRASEEEPPVGPPTPAISTVAGVRAFVDPETGELTGNPTRAQLQRQILEQRAISLSRSTTGLRPFELSRGGRGLNLQGRFQTAMRVERGADGSLHVTCGAGHEDGHSHDHSQADSASTASVQ